MKLQNLIAALEEIAPTRYAESWDNVGLLVGDPEQSVSRAMLTIDYTSAVADESRTEKCDCVIAYHPPIFETIKRLTSNSLIFDAIRRGVAIYSPHTALDVASGGTNDLLADILALIDRSPLKSSQTASKQYKLVTFVPANAEEKVSESLFAAGAGRIGDYSSCSFRTPGTGTFFGEPGTNPTVGQAGKFEQAEEIRLETVVPLNRIDDIIRALKQTHPYEEPAFDLVQLAAAPEGVGIGRIGKLPGDATADMLINRIKRELEIDHLLVAGDVTRLIKRAAV
ncbi:MAG TPA: Nif3-like dinuclear metal center hexameric protein, partial [Tepidisphaeraceae bacterium]|nr:Nif3-like dinuclear metal center hexameric protein [Tepidisphaeraceae bacterium]